MPVWFRIRCKKHLCRHDGIEIDVALRNRRFNPHYMPQVYHATIVDIFHKPIVDSDIKLTSS